MLKLFQAWSMYRKIEMTLEYMLAKRKVNDNEDEK